MLLLEDDAFFFLQGPWFFVFFLLLLLEELDAHGDVGFVSGVFVLFFGGVLFVVFFFGRVRQLDVFNFDFVGGVVQGQFYQFADSFLVCFSVLGTQL